jgi:hypothetical protein
MHPTVLITVASEARVSLDTVLHLARSRHVIAPFEQKNLQEIYPQAPLPLLTLIKHRMCQLIWTMPQTA